MKALPHAKKSLGQHWLTDGVALHALADAVAVDVVDTVLEIGPGPGALTEVLVDSANQVIAVEFDHELAKALPGRVTADNLRVIESDIMQFDLTKLPKNYKVVANIPYYLTSNLVRMLSESTNPPVAAALLVQQEVAQRIAALPGDMSLLSVTAQFYWRTELGMVVPARLFTPPPKVESQVIILHRRAEPLFPGVDEKAFFRLVKAGFHNRRKTLVNSLSGGLQLDKQTVHELLASAELKATARPQELSLEQWYALYQQLNT